MNQSETLQWISDQLQPHMSNEELKIVMRQIRQYLESAGEENSESRPESSRIVSQVLDGIPIAYIFEKSFFYESEFYVNSNVLVPRFDSESMVAHASDFISKDPTIERISDFGCGSGALGLSLLKKHSDLKGVFIDISQDALKVCQINSQRLKLLDRVTFEQRDLCSITEPFGAFDLILANPPYIEMGDPELESSVLQHEPSVALFSGESGLQHIRDWMTVAAYNLKKNRYFLCEMGWRQSVSVMDIFRRSQFWEDLNIYKDVAGRDRYICARRSS